MKTRSIFFSLVFAVSAFAFLTHCSGNKKEDAGSDNHDHDKTEHASGSTASEEAAEPQFQVDKTFQDQLAGVYSSYLTLKDAFVASDAGKVQAEAGNTAQALAKVDMKLVSGAAHNDWMSYLSPLESSLREISSSGDIEEQRKAFSTLSDNLYKSVKAFGLGGQDAFYTFCPMAFNNEGAYWLSNEKQVRNPYFGDKMLTCGQVKEKLK